MAILYKNKTTNGYVDFIGGLIINQTEINNTEITEEE